MTEAVVEPGTVTEPPFRRGLRKPAVLAAAVLFVAVAVVIRLTTDASGPPNAVPIEPPAPDSFTVQFETSAGSFDVRFDRAASPLGVDRAYRLAADGYWEGARIYRVNERYAQFGYSGDPGLDAVWVPNGLPDEPVLASNVRGAVSFARGGPGTRSAILFINRLDNTDLDAMSWNEVTGFPPIGRVSRGMEVVDRLYAGYGDGPLQWEDSIAAIGNPFLDRNYPELDSITRVRLVDDPGE